MAGKAQPTRGAGLEELLRAYFLRSGFFVIRGVPFRIADEDLTDVDLWLYERPTGTSRRVQICDIKYKQRPKAIERLFWTSGLADALEVDAAYVATTDKRPSLRLVAERLDLQLIDGTDIQRIQSSQNVLFDSRLTDEEFVAVLQAVDKEFKTKDFQTARVDILMSLSDGFGAPSAVRVLESFGRLAEAVITYRPDSDAAKAAGRLSYLAAAIACESLDFVSVGAAFRTTDERRQLILDAVRLGALSGDDGKQALKIALGLVEKYAPGGKGTAIAMETALKKDLDRIPAEIVADQAVRLLKSDLLFSSGRELESAAYQKTLPNFDDLTIHTKSMLGALLDYARIDRERFAAAWQAGSKDSASLAPLSQEQPAQTQTNLFQ